MQVEPSPWAYPADLQARRNRQAALDAAAEAAAQPPLPGDASASVAPAEASGAATGAAGDLLAETSATSLAAALLPPGMNSSNNLPSSASLAASRTNSMGQGEHHHLEQQLSGLLTRASHHPAGGHIMELDMGLEEGHDDEFAVQVGKGGVDGGGLSLVLCCSWCAVFVLCHIHVCRRRRRRRRRVPHTDGECVAQVRVMSPHRL